MFSGLRALTLQINACVSSVRYFIRLVIYSVYFYRDIFAVLLIFALLLSATV